MATNPIHRDEDAGSSEPPAEHDSRIGALVSPAHRATLEDALADHGTPSFNEVLASIPDVGLDSDFERNRA